MAYPSVTYSFINGATNVIDANEINQNFSDLVTGLSAGTKNIKIAILLAADGSSAAPSISFGNQTDLGFYKDAAAVIGMSGGLYAPDVPSGADQAAAGVGAGELWVDTSAGNVLKRGV
jgi:hypothetical protein